MPGKIRREAQASFPVEGEIRCAFDREIAACIGNHAFAGNYPSLEKGTLPVIEPSCAMTPTEPPAERVVTTGVAFEPDWLVFSEVKPSVRLAEPRLELCIAEPKVDGLMSPCNAFGSNAYAEA